MAGSFVGPGTATGTYQWTSGSGRFSHPIGNALFVVTSLDGVSFTVQFKGSLASAQPAP